MSDICRGIFRFLFLILFILSSERVCAQFGNIKLDIYSLESDDSRPLEIRIFRNDSVLIYKKNVYYDDIVQIDSINRGTYDILISKSSKRFLTLHNVVVKADSVTFLSVDLESLESVSSKISKDIGNSNASSSSPNFAFSMQTYQSGFSSRKQIVNSIYTIGIKFTPMKLLSKHYGIGANIGSNVGFCNLQKDKVQLFLDTFDVERYFYWKIFAGFNNRFVFVQAKDSKSLRPCFLDLGLGYNFPFIYRYVAVNRESKRIKGFISNLNDFSVTARMGFGFLAFTGSYRIANDLKGIYQTTPRIMFGVDFIIPND